MKPILYSQLASATLLSAAVLAQEPPSPPPPPPSEPGVEKREPAPPPPPPQPPRDPSGDRGPEVARPPRERIEQRPFQPRGGDRRGPEGGMPRGPGRPMDHDGPRGMDNERVKKPTPYLGVITSSAPPALAAQLGLSDGFGLVVEEVLPESPAQAAGLQRYDVLKQLNDQQLLDSNQLAALVRSLGKDTDATLTIVRKGQEQKLSVKIGEKLLPDRSRPDGRDGAPWEKRFPGAHELRDKLDVLRRTPDADRRLRELPNQIKELQEKARQYQDNIRKYEEQLRDWQQKREGEPPKLPPPPAFDVPNARTDGPKPPSVIFRELRPGATTDVPVDWYEGSSRWDASRARVRMKDHEGEVELALKDGHRMLVARDAAGATIFSGAVDTPEQLGAVPEPFRGKLQAFPLPPPERFTRPFPEDGDRPEASREEDGQVSSGSAERDVQ